MRQFVIILLLNLLTPIVSHSQTTYPIIKDSLVIITPRQLKETNLIFSEHEMLLKKVPLLTNQISTLEKLNKTYIEQDSIRLKELSFYKFSYENKSTQYEELVKKHSKCTRWIIIEGIITLCLGILICR